jgi:Relaxase/Mobilisation nuclease domain
MVARIIFNETLGSILDYNEQKVAQQQARLIHENGFLQHPDKLSPRDKTDRFARLNELNNRSKVNMLHATLNFDPSETFSIAEYAAITDRYMQGLGMSDQPYLVYEHRDAGHPHLHIVSSLIQANRRRIRTQNMVELLSEPTRLAIEKEFDLVPANHRQKEQAPPGPAGPPTRIRYGKDGAHHPAMARVIDYALRHYNVTTLAEFNAVLRQYNVIADPGGPQSRTRQGNGLTYRITDDHGRKKSAPVKASDFESQPTIARLEKIFAQNRTIRAAQVQQLERRLARVFFHPSPSFRDLNAELQGAAIELVIRQDRQGSIRDLVYIDHDTRLAVDASRLSRDFLSTFSGDTKTPGKGEQLSLFPPPTLPLLPGFSTQSPQLLSELVRHPHFDPPDDTQLAQEHQLKQQRSR